MIDITAARCIYCSTIDITAARGIYCSIIDITAARGIYCSIIQPCSHETKENGLKKTILFPILFFFFLYFLRSARRKLEICVSEYQYDSYRIRTAFLCARVLSLQRLAERYGRSSDICFLLCDFPTLLTAPP